MRVFITGIAGFIGSHVADRLLDQGHEVWGIDNYSTGKSVNVPGAVRFEQNVGDITQADVEFAVKAAQPEVVIHCAATYNDPEAWRLDARTNVIGTINTIGAAERWGARRVIYMQTSLCYGLAPVEQPITLAHPLMPAGSYAISKTAGERYLLESPLETVSLRLANMYGPRNLSGPVPAFYKRLTAGQTCTVTTARRDFVYVGDLVDLIVRALDGPTGVYHASSGRDYPIERLYNAVAGILGVDLPPVVQERGPDDPATLLLDPSETVAAYRWKPSTSLEHGILQAVRWYQEHGVTDTYTHLKLAEAAR